MDRTCVGLAYVGERPLTEREVERLRALYKKSRLWMPCPTFLIIASAVFWPAGFAIGLRYHIDWLEVASFADTIVLIVLALTWNDKRRNHRLTKYALLSDAVETYKGVPDESLRVEPSIKE